MPLTDKITMPDNSSIYIWHIDEKESRLRELYEARWPIPEEGLPVDEIKVARKRKQWYASRLLSAEAISEFQGIYYDQFGAPHLVEDDRCISYSHSYDKVALIYHEEHEVGIDIQKRDEKLKRISSKFLNEDEAKVYDGIGKDLDYLHILWSVKECIFKIHKHHMPFKEIRTELSEASEQGEMKVIANRFDGPHEHIVQFHKINGYFVAHSCYSE